MYNVTCLRPFTGEKCLLPILHITLPGAVTHRKCVHYFATSVQVLKKEKDKSKLTLV